MRDGFHPALWGIGARLYCAPGFSLVLPLQEQEALAEYHRAATSSGAGRGGSSSSGFVAVHSRSSSTRSERGIMVMKVNKFRLLLLYATPRAVYWRVLAVRYCRGVIQSQVRDTDT